MTFNRILLSLAALASFGAFAAGGDYVDKSGTITTGGTSQTLAAANDGRGGITIYNLSTETEVLCVNVTSAASCSTAGSWHITPGGSLTLSTKELITVVAATTGHKFTAKENVVGAFSLTNTGSASITGGAGDASAANQTTGNASLASIDGKTPALGQALAASSTPVVLTAAQMTTLTPVSTVTANAGTNLNTANIESYTSRLLSSAVPTAGGAATSTTALAVGGRYNSTPITITNGQEAAAQLDANGFLKVNVAAGGGATGVAQGSTTSGQTGGLTQAAVTTSAPTYTTGQTSPLSMDTSGQLRITGTVSAGGVAQGSTTSGQTGGLIQGAVTTSAPTYTTAQTSPLSLDTTGALRVNVTAGGAGGGNVTGGTAHDAAGAAVNPVLVGAYASAAAPTDVSADGDATRLWVLRNGATAAQPTFAGVLGVAGNGVSGTGVQRVTLASDSTGTLGVTATGGIGSLTETAPASDTASSGLNGRLQRIAQNLTTLNTSVTAPNTNLTDTQAPVAAGTATATKAVVMGGTYNSTPITVTNTQQAGAQIDANGYLKVNVAAGGAGGGAVTNAGTFAVQAAQTGTWTVQPGNTANTTAWKVDGSAVTQPVSISGNQAVNVAQINGVTPLMGAGNTGTGSARVTIATDQAAIATHGNGATGSAVPSGATMAGVRTGANMEAATQGSTSVAINVSTATTTQLVALSGATLIRVTGVVVVAGGTGNITFVYGTGSNCGTGTTSISGAIPLVANVGFTMGAGLGPVLIIPSGQALCVTTSAAVQMSGFLTYAQY